IAYSPMASGLLTGAMSRQRIARLPGDDWRRNSPNYREPLLSRNLRLVGLLRTIGARHGRTAGQVAVAWVLRRPAVTAALVGARRPGQMAELVEAATFRLSPSEAVEIEAFFTREAFRQQERPFTPGRAKAGVVEANIAQFHQHGETT